MKFLCVWVISCFLLIGGSSSASAQRRVALVIGNGAYISMPPLSNPVNDAVDVSEKLTSLGFIVISGFDLNRAEMERKIREFFDGISGSDLALFYYAGHGLQVAGQNYMAPVSANLASQDDLPFETISLDMILTTMEREAKSNLVFLDACRDNPIVSALGAGRSAGASRGLARVESGVGMMISYSTSPGQIARDGAGRNSPYTEALLRHLGEPGVDIALTMRKVRSDVLKATNNRQLPWEVASLTGDLVLGPNDGTIQLSEGPTSATEHQVRAPSAETRLPLSSLPGEKKTVFLYEERFGKSEPTAIQGNVVWSVRNQSPGGDAKPEPVIQAQINVPDRALTALLTIKRNADLSLPASHVIEFVFSLPENFEGGSIDSVQRVAMKLNEQDRGDALIAVPAKITEDFHMIALNDFPEALTQNIALLRERNWIDIPITYHSGQRSLLTLEKGAAEMKIFSQVLDIWSTELTAGAK